MKKELIDLQGLHDDNQLERNNMENEILQIKGDHLQEKVRLFSEIQDKDIEMGTNKTKIEKLNKTIGDLDTKLTKHDKEFESMKQELKEAYINLS